MDSATIMPKMNSTIFLENSCSFFLSNLSVIISSYILGSLSIFLTGKAR